MRLDRTATIGEVYDHPVGHDAIDKILLQAGQPRWIINNPVVRRLPFWLVAKLGAPFVGEDFFPTFLELLGSHVDDPSTSDGPEEAPWWRSAVFYQVYPRSFQDSDGDGVGDIPGIISRLDHLHDLGVDCVWLSPIFQSPNEDMGYDISDYRAVMEEMGTLEDLDALIAGCHERGMRLILDLVVNHTSDQHEWFQSAVNDPQGPHADFYHFRDGEPETPPNNWTSYFSGPAWRWVEERKQWVLRLFSNGQPDLNWENPLVRREVAEVVQWWMARGVDGFRLDVINFVSKRHGLPDGNPFIGELVGYNGIEHYFHGPRLHEYMAELRAQGFTRPGEGWSEQPGRDPVGVMIGETPGIGAQSGRLISGHDRHELDLSFVFDHLITPGTTRWTDDVYDLEALKRHWIRYMETISGNDWVALFWENHDNPRLTSKVDARPEFRAPVAKMLATMLLTLQGTPFIYQGQEIGAVNQDFRELEDFRDIETINRWAEIEAEGGDPFEAVITGSRDHARTPMRWDTTEKHGFTEGTPWIRSHEDSTGFTVEEQKDDPTSVLSWYKELIALRREHPALALGEIRFVDEHVKDYFAWFRDNGEELLLVELNLSSEPLQRPDRGMSCSILAGTVEERGATMAPYEATVSRVHA